MKTVLLKLDESVHKIWVGAAKRNSLSLSEWIREQCNVNVYEPTAHDVGRAGGATPRRRRARVATGGEHRVSVAHVNSATGAVTPASSSVLAHARNCSCGLCASKRKSVKD